MVVDRLRALAPLAARAGLRMNLDEISLRLLFGPRYGDFPCYVGWIELNTLVDGTITFCTRCYRAIGNVKERPLQDIWLGSEYHSLRRQYKSPAEREKSGGFDCERCALFYTNLGIIRRLSKFALVPRIDNLSSDWELSTAPADP